MNPYTILRSSIGTHEAAELCDRLAAWHDAMVAHERQLRTGPAECDEECPHVEAKGLWEEAQGVLGPLAEELTFLRTRAAAEQTAVAD